MQKVVIDAARGCLCLSDAGIKRYQELRGDASAYPVDRDDPVLVAVIEELGLSANGALSHFHIVEVPDNVEWCIEKDDTGCEVIREVLRTWG